MIYIFKSKAAADVVMLGQHAKRLLHLLERAEEVTGILTEAQVPLARLRLEQAIASDQHALQQRLNNEQGSASTADEELTLEDLDPHPAEVVHLAQRAYPLLAMLRAAERRGCSVVWNT